MGGAFTRPVLSPISGDLPCCPFWARAGEADRGRLPPQSLGRGAGRQGSGPEGGARGDPLRLARCLVPGFRGAGAAPARAPQAAARPARPARPAARLREPLLRRVQRAPPGPSRRRRRRRVLLSSRSSRASRRRRGEGRERGRGRRRGGGRASAQRSHGQRRSRRALSDSGRGPSRSRGGRGRRRRRRSPAPRAPRRRLAGARAAPGLRCPLGGRDAAGAWPPGRRHLPPGALSP